MGVIIEEYEGRYGVFRKLRAKEEAKMFVGTYIDTEGIPRWNSNKMVPDQDYLTLWNYIGEEFNYDKALEIYHDEYIKSTYRQRILLI